MSSDNEPTKHSDAIRLIEDRKYREAVDLLRGQIETDTDGENRALLALAHYHLEEYDSAVEHYQGALEQNTDNSIWQEMLGSAKANSIAKIQVHVPDVYYFDRDRLLAKPIVPDGALGPRPPTLPPAGPLKRISLVIGTVIGATVGLVSDTAIQVVGTVLNYRGKGSAGKI